MLHLWTSSRLWDGTSAPDVLQSDPDCTCKFGRYTKPFFSSSYGGQLFQRFRVYAEMLCGTRASPEVRAVTRVTFVQ